MLEFISSISDKRVSDFNFKSF